MQLLNHFKSLWMKTSYQVRRRILVICSLLILGNIVIWIAGFLFSQSYPLFLGLLSLAYGLGLRHAVDADHIAAIDNTTRKLMTDGKKPLAVGLFFSLGHSSVVIILSLLIALFTSLVKSNLPSFQATGTIIGMSISSIFLIVIGVINLITFLDILRVFRCITQGNTCGEEVTHSHPQGFLTRFFQEFFKKIHSSYQMYFIGFLFGLGFDTASEVGLLSISAASGASGTPLWGILLLPLAFTASMALVDTLDGIIMLGAYGWANIKPVRKLYYNLNITFISVIIALFIGGIEAIQLMSTHLHLHSSFFRFVNRISLENLGYFIILAFILSWIISIGIYKIKGYDRWD